MSICNGCDMPAGNAYPPDTWFRLFSGGGGGLYMLRLLSLAFPDLHKFHYFHTDLDLYQIARAFHWSFATSVACHQGRLPFRTLGSIPFLRLAYATIVETSFLDFTLVFFFSWFFTLNVPRYFLDFALNNYIAYSSPKKGRNQVSKRNSLLACHTRCKWFMEIFRNSVNGITGIN